MTQNETAKSPSADETITKQYRDGKLFVLNFSQDNISHDPGDELKPGNTGKQYLQNGSNLDMPGILDIKWCPHLQENVSLFGLVNSTGELRLCRLPSEEYNLDVVELQKVSLGESCLGLSLDWSNRCQHSNQG